jgi:PAS domain S-box-containing protein
MDKKPTYAKLEQRVKELEKLAVSYNQAKASLVATLEKHPKLEKKPSEPEIAVDVFDQEIDEHKPVEQAFIAEHVFRKTIEKSVPCGIVALDLDGRQTYVNHYFCAMIGWDEEELLGQKAPFISLPQRKPENDGYTWDLLSYFDSEAEDNLELQLRRKDGELFWALVQTAPLHDSDGQQTGMLMTVVDIAKQKEAEQKLRMLSSRLIDAQEIERKHISAELHDSIGAKLAGIKYSLEKTIFDIKFGQVALDKPLMEILSIVQDTIEETQRITKNLRPSILDDIGLIPAIRSYCREFQDIYSDIAIQLDCSIEEKQTPESIKILVYRVMQEALNNIAKHSSADKVDLTLKQDSACIILVIQDNGKGFDMDSLSSDEESQGLGLRSMSEKTQIFGGSLHIETKPGEGTLVQASWPYRMA